MDRALANVNPAVIEDLVDANRILYRLGVVDGFGHVSARHPADPSRFIISRSMAPALVTADDLMAIELGGRPVSVNAPTPYLERFIHGEIYAARPEVVAVVHSHSASIIPFTIVREATLKPVSHMSGFIGEGAPVFEIRETAGVSSDMLVRSPELGAALAKSLGPHNIVLMRGHGSTVVGLNLRQAVYRGVYAEVNARQQAEALRLGTPNYLTAGEALESAKANDSQQDRAWNLWKRAIQQNGLS
jgi:HCOMODA/2-hydroxy-3-carboxy-muconic semialdehyde decarboxylase